MRKANLPSFIQYLSYIFVLICTTYLSGCEQDSPSADSGNDTPDPRIVDVVSVEAGNLRESVRGIGSLRALRKVEIQPEVSGLIEKINFVEGRRIERNQLLYKIDDAKLQRRLQAQQSSVEAFKSQMANARWNFERMKELIKENVANEEEFKEARDTYNRMTAKLNQARAQLELIRQQIEDTRIEVPFDGVIAQTLVDKGDFVTVGEPLAVLYSIETLEVSFTLPEVHLGRVQRGQRVRVTTAAYPGKTFNGRVKYVSPSVDTATRDFRVKADINNEEGLLKPGVFVTAEIIIEQRKNAAIIPEEALVANRKGYFIFIVDNSKAYRKKVEIGMRKPGIVEIRQGLQIGQKVIRAGHMQLEDGQRVKVRNATPGGIQKKAETQTVPADTRQGSTQPKREDNSKGDQVNE